METARIYQRYGRKRYDMTQNRAKTEDFGSVSNLKIFRSKKS